MRLLVGPRRCFLPGKCVGRRQSPFHRRGAVRISGMSHREHRAARLGPSEKVAGTFSGTPERPRLTAHSRY